MNPLFENKTPEEIFEIIDKILPTRKANVHIRLKTSRKMKKRLKKDGKYCGHFIFKNCTIDQSSNSPIKVNFKYDSFEEIK